MQLEHPKMSELSESLWGAPVVITGAGFSADAGYPLERDVVARGLAHPGCPQRLKEDLAERFALYFGGEDFGKYSIEQILGRIYMRYVDLPDSDEQREVGDLWWGVRWALRPDPAAWRKSPGSLF
jgi:hypothetical protein